MFFNPYERTNVMLDRYTLDEFTPEERVRILLDSGSHLRNLSSIFWSTKYQALRKESPWLIAF